MARLVRTDLGCSARGQFCRELQEMEYAQGILVLPNRLLQEHVQRRYAGVDVMGMDRLVGSILNNNGYVNFKEINRRSQELLVEELLEYLVQGEQLEYFGALVEKPGFVKAMTSLVGQLARSGVTAQEINSLISSWGRGGHAGQKDAEVARLYFLYRQYLKNNNWFDLEGKFRLALRVLQNEKARIPWRKMYFCDFYSFNSLELALIKELAQHAAVSVGICFEKERETVFAAVRRTYLDLESFCEVKYLPQKTGRSAACEQVRKNLGRDCEPLAQGGVRAYCFAERDAEMRWVLSQVKNKLRQGVPAEKILVAARKLKNYSGLRLLADEYGVPVSLAQTSSLAVQPLTELVRLLLQAVPDNRDGAEAYFALLRGGLVPLLMQADAQAADALREKIYFTSRAQAQQKVHEALAAEDAVLQTCDEFIAQAHTRATLEEYGGQLLKFLEALQLEQSLGALYKEGKVALNTAAACMQACCSLQKVVRRLLQDYADCQRGEEKFSLREFQKKLDDAAEQEEIIIQCGRQDGVLLTEALNVQGLSFDYVYLLGMREGEFPCVDAENWIYNDKERGELNAMGIDMPDTAQAYAEDAYFFAAAAATARQELTFTYAEEDGIQASPYVDDVQKLFYEISDKDGVQEKTLPKTQKLCLLDKIPASVQEMERRGIACDEQWLQKTIGEAALEAAAVDGKRLESMQYNGVLSDKKLQQEVRRKTGSSFSASMLETYAACPFRFLGERVWRQQEFAPAEEGLQPADEGSLLHDVLAKFIGRHLQKKISEYPLNVLTEELQQDFADVSAEYFEQGRIVSTLLWQAEQPRLERLLLRWLRYEYEEQLTWDGYMPLAVEWDFSSKNGRPLPLRLQDGSRVTLNGRIDRIDSDGKNLVITDYKRSKAPSAKDAEEGFDVQLPLYLLAAAGLFRGGMNVAGGSYYVLKEGRRKAALLLQDVGNSNLEYKKRSSGINDGWESFENFCCALLDAYIEKIYSGEFAAKPRKECSPYCALRSICRYHELGAMQNGGAEHE